MIRKLLSHVAFMTLLRGTPPLVLLGIQTLHCYHSLSEVMDQQYYILMYVASLLVIVFIDLAVRGGICEPLEDHSKKIFIILDILSFLFAILINVFAYYTNHKKLPYDAPQYWFGLFAIVLITLMFEAIVRLVITIRYRKLEV